MLSIVIPTYNSLTHLKITLPALMRSIDHFMQSIPGVPVEIIISDDGSTDGSQQWVKDNFPTIQYCWHENLGRGPNRNYGASRTKGTQLVFLDSDIELEINTLVHLFSASSNQPVDVVFANIHLVVNERITPLDSYLDQKWEKLMMRFAKNLDAWDGYSGFFMLSSFLYNQLAGFSLEFKQYGGEDTEFFLRCADAGARFHFAEEAVGWHHQPLDLDSNLRRTYLANFSSALIVRHRPLGVVSAPMAFSHAWYDQLFRVLTVYRLWSKLRFLHLLIQYFPPQTKFAFYFYNFLFLEYAEKGRTAGLKKAMDLKG